MHHVKLDWNQIIFLFRRATYFSHKKLKQFSLFLFEFGGRGLEYIQLISGSIQKGNDVSASTFIQDSCSQFGQAVKIYKK
jgi:hypothetical protein